MTVDMGPKDFLAPRCSSDVDSRANVCFWHKADIPGLSSNVRFRGQRGHYADIGQCPLLTKADMSRLPHRVACGGEREVPQYGLSGFVQSHSPSHKHACD